ncbi:hypothetical protein M0R45_035904 [Rubus argutus]|uniref:Diphosphomevalonate decarboxylase-like N-terminal domain-containing protein n=1 Tax=Rubus argutus TaxID=59490 RepID=A0AAW1VW11_RUBAR
MAVDESQKWVLMVTAQTPTNIAVINPAFTQDRMWLNGEEISLSGGRFQSCLREIRSRACDVHDKEKGIKITKKDWDKLHVHIASYNNFPTAAGLASSAAGFACLVFALGKLMNVNEDQSQLSLSQGSGSACRSLYGGFVKWIMGKDEREPTVLQFNLQMISTGMSLSSLLLW